MVTNLLTGINRGRDYYLAIDGGTYTVGLCLFEIDPITNEMMVLNTHLINIRTPDHSYDYLEERHGFEAVRMMRLKKELHEYFDFVFDVYGGLTLVIYESHFFNVRRPTAAVPLVKFMQVTEETCIDYGVMMATVSPQQMKRTIGIDKALAKADKDCVKTKIQALIDNHAILYGGDLSDISEHEIDAMGIGYTQMRLDNLLSERRKS